MADKTILQWLSRHWRGLIASIALLTITFSVAYFFVLGIPKLHKHQIAIQRQYEQEQRRKNANRRPLMDCILNSQIGYEEAWAKNCLSRNENKDCSLPHELAESLSRELKENKKKCVKLYPIEK